MLEPAPSLFQGQALEALRRGVLGGPHFQDHLRSRPHVQLIDPHVEVVRPLVDGDHQMRRLLSLEHGPG